MRKMPCAMGGVTAACLLVACSTAPAIADAPPVATQAGLGIVVEIRPMMGPAYSAESVYFGRIDEAGQPSLSALYVSNLRRSDRIYLLNVPPGRYAAVAAVFRVGFIGPASTYVTYFPGPVIEKSTVEAKPLQVTYAGRYVLGTGIGVCGDKADPLQSRVAEAISPGAAKCGLAGMILHELASKPVVIIGGSAFTLGPSTYHYRGIEVISSNEIGERRAFLNDAQQELGTVGWSAAVH